MTSNRVSEQLRKAFELCVEKTRRNMAILVSEPKSMAFDKNGHYGDFHEGFFDIGNWTSSFFTGMALIAYRQTKDHYFLAMVQKLAPFYREKVFLRADDTMHDLGFLYSLYSVALFKLTGDRAQREIGLRAADVLAARFDARGGYIRAWGRMDEQDTDYAGLAIIDCLMNLPLLFWATEETGNHHYRNIALRHAETVLANMVRPDWSVFHALRFDVPSGAIVGEANYCGNSVGSQWARGMAWAIYGFALLYRRTGEERFRHASEEIALKFVANLGEKGIPVWDFKMLHGDNYQLDTSAASIALCGLLELELIGVENPRLTDAKWQLAEVLTSGEFLNDDLNIGGILHHAEVGDGVGKARYAYTSWGDYYLMEALDRILHGGETWW